MADRYQVMCINKSKRYDPHKHIENIGGVSGGKAWKITEDEAIRGIEIGKWSFYVSRGGGTVDVIVAQRMGRKYLKTVADGERPDNLLSLPECP